MFSFLAVSTYLAPPFWDAEQKHEKNSREGNDSGDHRRNDQASCLGVEDIEILLRAGAAQRRAANTGMLDPFRCVGVALSASRGNDRRNMEH